MRAKQPATAKLSIIEARSLQRDSSRSTRNSNLQPIPLHLGVHRNGRSRYRVLQSHSPLRPRSICLSNPQSCARREQRVLQAEVNVFALVILVAFAETIVAGLTANLASEIITACGGRRPANVADKIEGDGGAHIWRDGD